MLHLYIYLPTYFVGLMIATYFGITASPQVAIGIAAIPLLVVFFMISAFNATGVSTSEELGTLASHASLSIVVCLAATLSQSIILTVMLGALSAVLIVTAVIRAFRVLRTAN